MTSHDQLQQQLDALTVRMTELGADVFFLTDQVRRVDQQTNRLADGLDELEELLTEVDERIGETAAAMDIAMRQPQATTQRLAAIEADMFTLTEQVRLAAKAADRAAVGLDELEEILTEVDERAGETAVAMEVAMRQRQVALDGAPAASEHGGPTSTGTREEAPRAGDSRPSLDVLHAWVAAHIGPLIRKITATGEGGGIRWCRQWWRHHDAIERFTALHVVFTELSDQNTLSWLSAYLRDHLDPHLSVLTSPFGPFYACTPLRHSDNSGPLGHAELTKPVAAEPALIIADGSITAVGNGAGGTT